MSPLIFIHIPKTAGTSFRVSLEEAFKGRMISDYGPISPQTSTDIKEHVYHNEDIYGLVNSGTKIIGGHFPVMKYAGISRLTNIITFVREPVSRIISGYRHAQRHQDYDGSILKFAQSASNRNLITRYLKGVPLESIGFIGISEQFDKSLSLINHKYKLKLRSKILNAAPLEKSEFKLSETEIDEIKHLNESDILLYSACVKQFESRLEMNVKRSEFVAGGYNINKRGMSGFAFYENNDAPVVCEIFVNGQRYAQVTANKFYSPIHRFGGKRKGFVGFSLPDFTYNSADIVSCYVKDSGQELNVSLSNN